MLRIWPDGTWQWASEGEPYSHKSDDFMVVDVPEWIDDEDVEVYAFFVQQGMTKDEVELAIMIRESIIGPEDGERPEVEAMVVRMQALLAKFHA